MATDPIFELKEQLRREILAIAAKYPVVLAAMNFGIDTVRMSHLRKGNLERFSLEKLITILAAVHRRVEILVIDKSEIHLGKRMRERQQEGRARNK